MNNLKLLVALFIVSLSYAQNVVVTPNGLASATDNTKEYVVIEVPGKTASELYKNMNNYIQKNYNDPDYATKGKVENEHLHFVTHADNVLYYKAGIVYNVSYLTNVDFRDGKAKITFSDINLLPADVALPQVPFALSTLWNKKGELKKEREKLEIETYFNAQLKLIKGGLTNDIKKEEW